MWQNFESLNYEGLFEKWEIDEIKRLVRIFMYKYPCLRKEQPEDLVQECVIHWFYKGNEYDPSKGIPKKAFLRKVICNKLIDLTRERATDKRRTLYEAYSLDKAAITEENLTTPYQYSKIDSEIDIVKATSKLNPEQKNLFSLIWEKELSITEISDHLNIPRPTIYDRIKQIRETLRNSCFKDYL